MLQGDSLSLTETWIEAAVNGPWGRKRQPLTPIAPEEIIAEGIECAEAGAGIIHVHAYDVESGQQHDDWQIYARIIEGIRSKIDVIVYPTIPLAGSSYAGTNAEKRFAHIAELAQRGLIEWTVLDPGSVNFARFDEIGSLSGTFIYQNPPADIQEGMRIARQYRLHPSYAIYEPGFARLGAALSQDGSPLPTPVYRFMFSTEFAWGFPPKSIYLESYLHLLSELAPASPWMVGGLGVDIRGLLSYAVSRGGHIRVGLEDAPWATALTNRVWVEEAVRLLRLCGGEPAAAKAIRAAIGENDHS
jgi:3-keto-5-aminohexanoate cleavage enzyme